MLSTVDDFEAVREVLSPSIPTSIIEWLIKMMLYSGYRHSRPVFMRVDYSEETTTLAAINTLCLNM